jgi:acyl carrier protein
MKIEILTPLLVRCRRYGISFDYGWDDETDTYRLKLFINKTKVYDTGPTMEIEAGVQEAIKRIDKENENGDLNNHTNVIDATINVDKEDSELFHKIKETIGFLLGVPEKKITLKSSIVEDLKANSLDSVELIMQIEEDFGVTILDEDAVKIKTVEDIYNWAVAYGSPSCRVLAVTKITKID